MADQVIYIPVILRQLKPKGSVGPTDIIGISDENGNVLFKTTIQALVQNSGVSFSGGVAGVANTDTTPAVGATPESQVIYIAGSGTFSNFPGADSNPIVLTENLNVISWDGTKASVQEVPVNVDLSPYALTGGSEKSNQDLDDLKMNKADIKYKSTSAQQFDKATVLRNKSFLADGILINNLGSITSAPMAIPDDQDYIGIGGLSLDSPTSAHRYRFLDASGNYIDGSAGLIAINRSSHLVSKFSGAAYFQLVIKNPSEPNENMLDTVSVTFGSFLSDNQFDPNDYIENFRVVDSVDLGSAAGYKTGQKTPIPDGAKSVFLDGLKLYNHTARFCDATAKYIADSYFSVNANSGGGLFAFVPGAKYFQITYKNGGEPDDDVNNTFVLKFSDCDPSDISSDRIVDEINGAKILNYDSDLYSDYIVGTTQEPTFIDGQLIKMEHKKDGVTVRTDTFTYSSNTITETRITDNGRVVFVTDLTTLITQISN